MKAEADREKASADKEKAAAEKAEYNLKVSTVRAPADGMLYEAADFKPGRFVAAGTSLFTLVETEKPWIEANFKETELTRVRPGQKVLIHVDTYPESECRGTVSSIAQSTGAEFAVLPPQNASGNWVKVVQRVPIRLNVEMPDGAPPLRTGMSAYVEIDTGHHRQLRDLFSGF